eukprot:753873-Hanusia_phi.AAC.3
MSSEMVEQHGGQLASEKKRGNAAAARVVVAGDRAGGEGGAEQIQVVPAALQAKRQGATACFLLPLVLPVCQGGDREEGEQTGGSNIKIG